MQVAKHLQIPHAVDTLQGSVSLQESLAFDTAVMNVGLSPVCASQLSTLLLAPV